MHDGSSIYDNERVGSGAKAIDYTGGTGAGEQRVVGGNVVDTGTDGAPTTPCPPDVPAGEEVGHSAGTARGRDREARNPAGGPFVSW